LTLSFRPRRLLSAKCCNQKGLGCRVGKAKRNPPFSIAQMTPLWWVALRFTHPTL